MNFKHFLLFSTCILLTAVSLAQKTGGLRGSIRDQETGESMIEVSVYLAEDKAKYNSTSDLDGFYSINNVPVGTYTLKLEYVGYKSVSIPVTISAGKMTLQNVQLAFENVITDVVVSATKETEQNEVGISTVRITSTDILRLPSAGEPDLVQYLQVIPGVIVTGDQGGQLYIRGGAPIQNRILLDGMTIYNAFHSIGFFSVFETETIKTVDLYTGGFSAKYGGRSSAVVDIKTRAGNRKRFAGRLSVNPFVAKGLFEGPLIKMKEDGTGSTLSFLMTLKHSYLRETSSIFYAYANEQGVLPYNFTDGYAKLSFLAENGSRLDAFGFSYNDNARFDGTLNYNWNAGGAGLDFRIVPGTANILMDGTLAYSNYRSRFIEGNNSKERFSLINSFSADLNFIYYMAHSSEFNYGLEFTTLFTNFDYTNNGGIGFDQKQSNNEAALYVRYRGRLNSIVIEPSFRVHFYASLGEIRAEPRIGMKYNITDFLRFKFAGGLYSQNLISSVDERDVVNLFVGFLGSPDEGVFRAGTNDAGEIIYTQTRSKLQTSIHGIGGVEANVTDFAKVNIEGYWKYFPQIISLNRNINREEDPKYIAEKGTAQGLDFSATFEKNQFYVYLAYSLGYVQRNDGVQSFFASFDRRHNINLLSSYKFGKKKDRGTEGGGINDNLNLEPKIKNPTLYPFELSLRWNLGSGFPFTRTAGFFDLQTFQSGINWDFLSNNTNPGTQLGVIYEDQINGGRLPYYHRLDFSFKYTLDWIQQIKLNIAVSITNVYNRENIFYFDRVTHEKIEQLPIMPSLNLGLKF